MATTFEPGQLMSRLLLCAIAVLPFAACGGSDVIDPPPPPPPVIGLSPASATFSFTVGGASPAPVTVAVTSTGSNAIPVTGLVIGNIGYGAGANGWLTATLSGSETPATLTLTASTSGITPGTYTANVPVSSSMTGVAAPSVPVTYTVAAQAPTGEQVYIAGNIAQCGTNGDQATAALLDNLPGTIFTAGDNAFPQGTANDYATCYDVSWGRFKSRTWAALGNHEYDQGHANDAFDYFGGRAGPRGKGFYSVDIGGWHIIVLNDNRQFVDYWAGSEQLQWLSADLAGSNSRCTMAIWHQPLFFSSTSGVTQGSERKVLWDTLYAHGVDVVVNGHMHHYERMAPMNPSGARDDAAGIRQFNNGNGGASTLMPTTTHPNSQSIGTDFGVLQLTLRATSYDWKFIPIAGNTFTDTGSGSCH